MGHHAHHLLASRRPISDTITLKLRVSAYGFGRWGRRYSDHNRRAFALRGEQGATHLGRAGRLWAPEPRSGDSRSGAQRGLLPLFRGLSLASHAQRDSWPEREGARPPCFQPRPPPAGARHGPGPAPGHPCAVLPPSSRSETQEPRPSSAQNPQQSPPRPEKRHGHGDIHSTLLVTASTWGQPRAHRQEGGKP